MSEAFEFATAGRIVFGVGRLNEVGTIAREFGRRVLLVTGGNSSRAEPLREQLIKAGCEVESIAVAGEPTIELAERAALQEGVTKAEVTNPDFIGDFEDLG